MATPPVTALPAWWQLPQASARWVRDVVIAEMSALRPQGWRWPAPDDGDLHWHRDGGLDSLERVAIATAVADAADLRDVASLQALDDQDTWRGWAAVVEQAFAQRPPEHRFRSSGTTGRGTVHCHALGALVEELQAALIGFTGGRPPRRLVSTVRSHHIYGFLFTQLLPWVVQAQGLPVPEVVDLAGRSPALVKARAAPGDWIIGFPEFWSAAARTPGTWPAEVVGVSSTAPCPPAAAEAAHAQGIARWIEIYGSTETAGVAWRSAPEAPFQLHPHWQADPTDPQQLLRTGHWPRRCPLPDRVEWLADRHLRPLARCDGQVQVAGVNVDPTAVVACLQSHPGVREAAVRLYPTPYGQRLKAYVAVGPAAGAAQGSTPSVPLADPERHLAPEVDALHAWCKERLPSAACPVSITLGSVLPRTEMGKLRDWDPGQSPRAA